MNTKKYIPGTDTLKNLNNQSSETIAMFFQHILLVASSMLAIILSLHEAQYPTMCIRVVFLLSTVLLSLGILMLGIVVYNHAQRHAVLLKILQKEVEEANKNQRAVDYNVCEPEDKIQKKIKFQNISLIVVFASLLSFAIYMVLRIICS